MLNPSEFFTPANLLLVVPVVFAGVFFMPLLYTGISNAIIPWKDIVEDELPLNSWSNEDRRKVVARRNEERMATAREAWRRGDQSAPTMIGRRRSDYEALGIPFPEEQ